MRAYVYGTQEAFLVRQKGVDFTISFSAHFAYKVQGREYVLKLCKNCVMFFVVIFIRNAHSWHNGLSDGADSSQLLPYAFLSLFKRQIILIDLVIILT